MPFTIPNSVDAAFTAQAEPDSRDFDIMTAAAAQTGVVTGCAVTTTAAGNGSVSVAAGTIRVAGRKITVATGTVGPLGANATGNPRFDLITVDTSGTKAVVAGTAAATPVFPAIPASRVVLAAVYVANGHTTTTTLAANTITDKRVILIDAELENVFWYGATGNARSFVATAGTTGTGTVTSQLATPTGAATSTATTGGSLAAATYSYRVSAYNQYGETTASTGVTRVTTGTTSTVTVTWTAVAGALGYKVYGRVGGSELFLQVVRAPLTTFTDTGGWTPAGALPGANTTGPFTAAHVGRAVYISAGGAAGVQYAGTVSAFTSATQITVSPNLSTTLVAGATGAVGTDDSTAIDSAVAALVSGSTLYFPAGQYLASSSGVVVDGKSNLTITGDYATIIGISETAPVVNVHNAAQLGIDRLRIQHATTTLRNGSGYGIEIKFCEDVVIEDCYVFQTCAAGIYIDNVSRATVVANTVTQTLADGIHTTGASTDIDVVGNRLYDVGDDAIAFVSYRVQGNPVDRFTATTNAIYRCKARGIAAIGAAHGSIVGNSVNATKGAGIIVAMETGFVTFGVTDVTVSSNTVIDANTYNSPSVDHAAIHVVSDDPTNYPVNGVTIIGNHVKTPRRYGFLLDGTNIVMSNNSFIGPSGTTCPAVMLGGVTPRVYGNRIAFASQNGLESYSVTRGIIIDNEFWYPNQVNEGGRWGIVQFGGGSSTIRDNIVFPDPSKQLAGSVAAAPSVAAVSGSTGAGTTPPTPTVDGGDTDQCGKVSFGTGSGTVGTGAYVTITFNAAHPTEPLIVLTPANQATAVKQPYITNITTTTFQIGLGVAGAVSQGATTYQVAWHLTEG